LHSLHFFKFVREIRTDLSTSRLAKKPSFLRIDMFLNKAAEDKTGIFTEKQLIHNCMDLFLAGSETTSKSIQVSVFYPKKQLIQNCMDKFGPLPGWLRDHM
jgi:cytochrome P450